MAPRADEHDPLPWIDGHGRRYAMPFESDHCQKCSTTHAPRNAAALQALTEKESAR